MKGKNYGISFSKYYDLINQDKDYGKEVEVVDEIIKENLKTEDDNSKISIADVGCGTGTHSILLSKLGYNVYSYDASPHMIKAAKSKAPDMHFECKNFAEVDKKFDVIISLFDVVNALGPYDRLISFFKSIHESMKPESIFIFDCWNGDAVIKDPPKEKTKVIEKGSIKIIRKVKPKNDLKNKTSLLEYNIETHQDGKLQDKIKNILTIHFFTREEMSKALEESGFKLIKTFPYKELNNQPTNTDWKINFVCRIR